MSSFIKINNFEQILLRACLEKKGEKNKQKKHLPVGITHMWKQTRKKKY